MNDQGCSDSRCSSFDPERGCDEDRFPCEKLIEYLNERIAALEAELREKDESLRLSWDHKDDYGKQITTLTEELRLANLRSESLDRIVAECNREYVVLKAERDILREDLGYIAFERNWGYSQIVSTARAALHPGEYLPETS
jgi:chromosome segregation ATPase